MKTFATMTILAGSTLLCGTDSASAQCSRTRPIYRRVVIQEPSYIVSRPIVTQPVVTYGGFSHIDELASELEQLTRDILWEMHFNYTHNSGYDATYAEMYDILRQAKYIHEAEHYGRRSEIARVVGDLDRLFHHVEEDIRLWRPSHGHFVGNGSLFDKVEALEDTLHHLMQDVGATASNSDPPAPRLDGNPLPPVLSGLLQP